MIDLNLTPIITTNSVFKHIHTIYVYKNKKGDSHIHFNKPLSDDMFTEGTKINFMFDYDANYLFIFPHPDYGQTVSKAGNRTSVKCNMACNEIGVKSLPALKDSNDNSGRTLIAYNHTCLGFDGILINMSEFIK